MHILCRHSQYHTLSCSALSPPGHRRFFCSPPPHMWHLYTLQIYFERPDRTSGSLTREWLSLMVKSCHALWWISVGTCLSAWSTVCTCGTNGAQTACDSTQAACFEPQRKVRRPLIVGLYTHSVRFGASGFELLPGVVDSDSRQNIAMFPVCLPWILRHRPAGWSETSPRAEASLCGDAGDCKR